MLVGRAIASVVDLLDLSLAVVSGSVALGFGEPFFAAAQAEMDQLCRIEFARGARVVPGGLGDGGPLVGAARVGLVRGGVGVSGGAAGAPARRDAGWSRDARVVVRAVRAPSRALVGLRRRPASDGPAGLVAPGPLPAPPGEAYWRFRLVTAYGGDGGSGELTPADVVAYLRWCQRSRPRRG